MDDDDDYIVKQRLGYKPYAPPPDIHNVKTKINNRQSSAVKKKMKENKNQKENKNAFDPVKRFQGHDFWPQTPPEKQKQINQERDLKSKNINQLENDLNDKDLGIRESHSAPFDEVDSRNNSPKKFQNIPEKSDSPQSRRYSNNSTDTHRRRRFKSYSPPNERKSRRNSMDSYKNRRFHSGSRDSNHKFKNYQKTLPLGYLDSREDSARYDTFRTNSKSNVKASRRDYDEESEDSDLEYVIKNKVKKGIVIRNRPFSVDSVEYFKYQTKHDEKYYHEMRENAEWELRHDNQVANGYNKKFDSEDDDDEDVSDNMKNVCCLLPCCCCFCKCVYKKDHSEKH